ncbi:MAG: response regulator [Myxococcota bacterium]|nr:response regulator [Myxococcota bacterium]
MNELLGGAGFEVETAKDGVKAPKKVAKEKRYDLPITDINMPNINGIKFIALVL